MQCPQHLTLETSSSQRRRRSMSARTQWEGHLLRKLSPAISICFSAFPTSVTRAQRHTHECIGAACTIARDQPHESDVRRTAAERVPRQADRKPPRRALPPASLFAIELPIEASGWVRLEVALTRLRDAWQKSPARVGFAQDRKSRLHPGRLRASTALRPARPAPPCTARRGPCAYRRRASRARRGGRRATRRPFTSRRWPATRRRRGRSGGRWPRSTSRAAARPRSLHRRCRPWRRRRCVGTRPSLS